MKRNYKILKKKENNNKIIELKTYNKRDKKKKKKKIKKLNLITKYKLYIYIF